MISTVILTKTGIDTGSDQLLPSGLMAKKRLKARAYVRNQDVDPTAFNQVAKTEFEKQKTEQGKVPNLKDRTVLKLQDDKGEVTILTDVEEELTPTDFRSPDRHQTSLADIDQHEPVSDSNDPS